MTRTNIAAVLELRQKRRLWLILQPACSTTRPTTSNMLLYPTTLHECNSLGDMAQECLPAKARFSAALALSPLGHGMESGKSKQRQSHQSSALPCLHRWRRLFPTKPKVQGLLLAAEVLGWCLPPCARELP